MNTQILPKVLDVDQYKCVNCHKCIAVCPVKYCNDGSGEYVKVNGDMCIACGSCIKACTHDARNYIDDFSSFLENLEKGTKMVAIVAPSAAANFPGQYLNLNGWLKSIGIKAIFDVSFGAELTVKSYLEYISKNNPQTVIAQPCAAIVSYIQLYKPELLKYLAPVDSPMLHTIKMIHNFYPEYRNYQVAIISPCGAKKREFQETGLGNYNIAYQSVDKYLKSNNLSLSFFPKADFDNPPAERAVMFSTPGGLMETVERSHPELRRKTRKIEGVHLIYDYLEKLPQMIKQKSSPLLIDCLNCDFGCNAGPLTMNRDKSPDEIEFWINQRSEEMQNHYLSQSGGNSEKRIEEIEKTLDKYWDREIYKREYVNLWENNSLKYPTKEQMEGILNEMHKYSEKDQYNCTTCGYGSCEKMAVAIFNGLNKAGNCHFYLIDEEKISKKEVEKSKAFFSSIIETSLEGFIQIDENSHIILANPAIKMMLKRNDLVGRKLSEFVDEQTKPILERQLELRKHNVQSSYELSLIQSDGNKVICLLNGTPLMEDGKFIGSFAMIADITELKKAQDELTKANDELELRVQQRTFELQESLEEVRQQSEELMTQSEILGEQERKLNDIIQYLPDAVMVINRIGEVIYWNQAMEELTGILAPNIIGKGNREYSIPFYGERRPILIDLVYEPIEGFEAKYSHIKRNNNILIGEAFAPGLRGGSYLWGTAAPFFNTDEEIIGAIEIVKDITDRKKAEQELEKANQEIKLKSVELSEMIEELRTTNEVIEQVNGELEKLSLVASKTDNAVLIMDAMGIVEWGNDGFLKLYGTKPYELLGKHITEVINNEDISEIFNKCKNQKQSILYQNQTKTKQGNIIWAQTTLTPLTNDEGEVIKFIAIDSDITKQKEAEDEIRLRNEEIASQRDELEIKRNLAVEQQQLFQLSEAKYRFLVENLNEIIYTLNEKGEFSYLSPSFEYILKYNTEDFIGKHFTSIVKHEDVQLFDNKKGKGLQTSIYEPIEFRLISNENNPIWLRTHLQPIIGESSITGYQGIITDITERKLAAEALKESEKKLRVKNGQITDSIQYASRIQTAILPPESIISNILPENFVLFKPRDIVSGDFYWIRKKFEMILIAAGDCTGHGVPGAMMSMLGVAFLNEILNNIPIKKSVRASEMLDQLRHLIKTSLRQENAQSERKDGMDIALCVIDINNSVMQYSGAHNPLYIYRNGELIEYKADKMPIGVSFNDKEPFANNIIEIHKGDALYLATDGYMDQIGGEKGGKFLSKHFKSLLLEIHAKPMQEQKELLETTFNNWKSTNYSQVDDVLVMGMRI